MGVGIKAQRKSAPWEKACSEARAAVRLQSPCSCRCFGSKTSMFSIHCRVIKLVRQNWKAYWFETEDTSLGGTHQKSPVFMRVQALHHVAAGRLSREIFKGLQSER